MRVYFRICLVGLVLMGIVFLNGCNTVKGFGEDMQQGGQNLQKAAAKDQ